MAGGLDLESAPFWQKQPILPEHLEGVYRAFMDLSSSRPVLPMGGAGSITFAQADRYAARYPVDDFDEFWVLIRKLDDVFLREVRRRQPTVPKGGGKS